jgi:hypothetical protein
MRLQCARLHDITIIPVEVWMASYWLLISLYFSPIVWSLLIMVQAWRPSRLQYLSKDGTFHLAVAVFTWIDDRRLIQTGDAYPRMAKEKKKKTLYLSPTSIIDYRLTSVCILIGQSKLVQCFHHWCKPQVKYWLTREGDGHTIPFTNNFFFLDKVFFSSPVSISF